jgi:hypothetical protein
MSSSYKYNGQDVYNLLNSTGLSNSTPFKNFPTSPAPQYGSTIDMPLLFNYKVNNVDLSNTNTAHNGQYNATGTITITNPPAGTINVPYKHISAFCCGGGGGGGGGGGAGGDGFGDRGNGGEGGDGAPGGYAAVVQYPINNEAVVLTIGAGGLGGGGGSKNTNSTGQSGGAGDPGEITTLKIGNATVLQAYGGGYGKGGQGGRTSKGANGNTNANTTNSAATGGKINTIDANTPSSPYWPTNNSVGGLGGDGGNVPSSSNSGDPGSNGYAQVWFLYQA